MVLLLCIAGGLIAGFTIGIVAALADPHCARRYLEGFSAPLAIFRRDER